MPLRRQRADLGGGMRLDHHDAFGVEPAGQPARQHRAAHLAGAGERDGAGDVFERLLVVLKALTTNTAVVPAKAGTHNHRRF